MDVTPQLLKDVEFAERWRGYDQGEVDEFLERVAAGVAELRQRAQEAEARAESAERRAAVAAAAGSEVDGVDADTLRRTLLLAQRTADAVVREAEEQAGRTVAEAEERVSVMLAEATAEADRAVEETRTRLLQEIAELEDIRDALRGDVGLLERHLDDARQRLRASLRDLQEVVDHPELLRTGPAPVLSGASEPQPPPTDAAEAAARAVEGDDVAAPPAAAGPGAGPAWDEPGSHDPGERHREADPARLAAEALVGEGDLAGERPDAPHWR